MIRKSLRVVTVIVALLVSTASMRPMPTVYPKRVINNHTVNLSPLFAWWDEKHGGRPLTAWKHLEGVFDQETVQGWLCRGSIEGQSGRQYFLLKNPPQKELVRYRELENQLSQLQYERTAKLEVAGQPAYETWNLGVYSNSRGTADDAAFIVPRENFEAIKQANSELQNIDVQIQSVRQEMAGILTKDGHFKIDGFALQVTQRYQGHPVFDFGYPLF